MKIIRKVKVTDEEFLNEQIFTYCAAVLVLLMFLNLGTVLDLKRLKAIFLRPIGPFIGFCSRYFLMPGLSLLLGRLLFHNNKDLQLGLLFTAISPSGGLANIFIIFLKGNINLALATTTLNSLLALAMLPFWILIVVPKIYDEMPISVPFVDLAVSAVAIIAAISVGVILRKLIPKTTTYIFRFLKPLSVVLSFTLVALTVGLNYFVFKDVDLSITAATLLLPFIGYLLSFGLAKLLCCTWTDALTIGIETSVLNMTLPILLLLHSLEQEQIDNIIVIPIMSSLISLFLVLIFYIVRRVFGWNTLRDDDAFDEKRLLTESN